MFGRPRPIGSERVEFGWMFHTLFRPSKPETCEIGNSGQVLLPSARGWA